MHDLIRVSLNKNLKAPTPQQHLLFFFTLGLRIDSLFSRGFNVIVLERS